MAERKGQWTKGFYSGALAALTHVSAMGQEVLYAGIVESIGATELWDAAEDFDREHLEKNGFKPGASADDGAAKVECCRCKNKHKEVDRLEVPSKGLLEAVDLVCPRCKGKTFYRLDAKGKRY